MSGADLQDVAELLGHRDLRMAKRYAHLSPAHLQNAVEGLDGVFSNVKELLLPAKLEDTFLDRLQPPGNGRDGTPENAQTDQSSCSIVPTGSPAV